jgi:hypothetical protein
MYKLSSQQFAAVFQSLRTLGASDGQEKRIATRMDVQARVNVALFHGLDVSRCFTALTRDVSTQGVGLFMHVPVELEKRFLISLPCGKSELVLICVSRFCRAVAEGMFGIGAEFDGVADSTVVQQLTRQRGDTVNRIRDSVLG